MTAPVSLVLDLRITHGRWGSSSVPSINGNLHYPNDIDSSLNESVTDKIRKYHTDYNNKPPNVISFMTAISSTSGRIHSELVRLLFLRLTTLTNDIEDPFLVPPRGTSHTFPHQVNPVTYPDDGPGLPDHWTQSRG